MSELAWVTVTTDDRAPQDIADEIAATVTARIAAETGRGRGHLARGVSQPERRARRSRSGDPDRIQVSGEHALPGGRRHRCARRAARAGRAGAPARSSLSTRGAG